MIVMISLMNKTIRQKVKAKFYYNDCHDISDEHQNCTTKHRLHKKYTDFPEERFVTSVTKQKM